METKTDKSGEVLSQEEKIEMVKTIFSSLEIDKKAELADWCHEEVRKGTPEFLKKKMVEMNEDVNRVVSKLYDKVIKTGKKIYDETNETFKTVSSEENTGENSSSGNNIFD